MEPPPTRGAHEPALREARPRPGEPKAEASVLRLALRLWPFLLGNVIEWYEFSVYAFLSPQIKANFFHGSDFGVWFGFAFTFLPRPLGGVILGWLGDRFGRRVSINLSIVGMLGATVCQGLLPTYRSGNDVIGRIGFVLLLTMRMIQGVSAGGEIAAIISYLFETAPLEKIGRLVVLVPVTIGVSFLLTSSIVEVMVVLTTKEQMYDWGWRIPFILVLPPGLLTIWGRSRVPESELFLQEVEEQAGVAAAPSSRPGGKAVELPELEAEERLLLKEPRPGPGEGPQAPASLGRALWEVLRHHGPAVAVTICYLAGPALGMYVATMWVVSYLEHHALEASHTLLVSTAGRLVFLPMQLFTGWLIDVQGIGWVTIFGCACFMLLGLPIFWMLNAYGHSPLVAVLGVAVGYNGVVALQCCHMFTAELFPTKVRALALGFSLNVGFCLFGGFGGLMAEASRKLTPLGPGLLLSGGAAVSLASVLLARRLEGRGLLRLAHRRTSPYWGRGEVQSVDQAMFLADSTTKRTEEVKEYEMKEEKVVDCAMAN